MRRSSWFVVVFLLLALLAGCGQAAKNETQSAGPVGASALKSAGEGYVTSIERDASSRESIVLVSWNACNFGRSKTDQTIAFMAELLRNADIIALQEVSTSNFGAQAVAKLSDELNRKGAKWDYVVSDATHESGGKERYAFLWKTARIEALPRRAVLAEELKDDLEREPAKINFRIGGKNFTVASFHLVPTQKHPEREAEAVGEKSAGLSGSNTIFVGDFNLSHKKLDGAMEGRLGLKHCIQGKTSLKTKPGKGGLYLAKEYDNIYVGGGVKVHRSAILDFVPYFKDVSEARHISDHLPVFIIFDL
jgi:endonuclease/exonuclease/phosphatase family metal-dependent hydrolase